MGTVVGHTDCQSDFTAARLNFQLGLRKVTTRCRVRRQPDLKVIGAAHLTADGWRALNKHSILTAEQASRDLFKIITPPKWGTQALNLNQQFLFEGDSLTNKVSRRIEPLGKLHGWGAPLKVRSMFNASHTPSLSLAASILNHGELEDVICEA